MIEALNMHFINSLLTGDHSVRYKLLTFGLVRPGCRHGNKWVCSDVIVFIVKIILVFSLWTKIANTHFVSWWNFEILFLSLLQTLIAIYINKLARCDHYGLQLKPAS